jgi:hypothetical protein
MKLIVVSLIAFTVWAQEPGPLMQSILSRYQTAKLNLMESAAAMPEADYGFKLTPAQRTFGEWMEHNIEMNYNLCSILLGQAAPKEKIKHGVTAKAELESGLKESFGYCDGAFQSMTDEKALKEMDAGGGRRVLPASTMIGLLINWNEHYGNLVGYLRTKGITPPSTARAQKARKQ